MNNPELLHVTKYTDINSEIFNRYVDYARDLGRPLQSQKSLNSPSSS